MCGIGPRVPRGVAAVGRPRRPVTSTRHVAVTPTVAARAVARRDTHAVAAALAGRRRAGDVIVLAGEMGAGKTAFAQGFGRALGVTEPITSPTFTLVHSYDTGGPTLHHADLYRLDQLAEVADLALGELAEFDGIVLVEWGDVVESTFGEHLVVRLDLARRRPRRPPDHDRRPTGPTWARRAGRCAIAGRQIARDLCP